MSEIYRSYRLKRPKQYSDLLNLLKEELFPTLISALNFAAAVGFYKQIRKPIKETAEPIPFSLLGESREQPFFYLIALSETNNVEILRPENFLECAKIYEEYAHGGLEFLESSLDRDNIKESIEMLIASNRNSDILDDIASEW